MYSTFNLKTMVRHFLLLLFILSFFFSCGVYADSAISKNIMTPALSDIIPFEENGKWGLKDQHQNIILSPQWDQVDPARNGYAKIYKDEKIGYTNILGEVVIEPQWDIASDFHEGYAKVAKSHVLYNRTYNDYREGYYFIDTKGELLTPTIWGEASVFIDGIAMVQKNFKWGFINQKGTVIYPLQWDDIYPLTDEVSAYPNYQYIDDEEGLGPWENRSLFLGGLIVIVEDDLCGLLNDNWEVVLPPTWEGIEALSEGLLVVIEKGTYLYGFIDTKGNIVLPPQWEEATSFKNGQAQVKKDGQWYTINTKGETVDSGSLLSR